MGLEGKLEAEVEMKASADRVFKLLAEELNKVPDASPDNIQGVEVHEGDWATAGSVKLWNYIIDGQNEVFKEKVHIDEESKMVSMEAVGGHILDKYKTYKIICEVLPHGGSSSKVKAQVIYEKLNEDDADPDNYLGLITNIIKDIDAHLVGKQA
ncbi:hypothetical protein MLD38_011379 [Melastoma candidum]|uniref:Uncharacterized protein n=1 Tax=Melastoma candidum TaxID=119954 RepID=A0ACB9R2V4_9MYRT|nr:hypothetical protein MLD38_011379 [Melastoma candidum]